jgi:predicted negative regulator of RcsB-dependent stress response
MALPEKEDDKQGSSFWDWIIGIGLVVLIGGFTVYYQYQKRSSISRGKQADSLYVAGNYVEAERMYEELKSAQYLTPHDDSIIYARLDTIETAKEGDAARVAEARAKLQAGDTVGAASQVSAIRFKELLSAEDKAFVEASVSKASPAQAQAETTQVAKP